MSSSKVFTKKILDRQRFGNLGHWRMPSGISGLLSVTAVLTCHQCSVWCEKKCLKRESVNITLLNNFLLKDLHSLKVVFKMAANKYIKYTLQNYIYIHTYTYIKFYLFYLQSIQETAIT